MIELSPIIDRIETLLAEDTEASVTYAALEARLALEKLCYDRLRQRHDYISHDQLRKWQPGAVVNTLINEVDQHLGETVTLSIGKSPPGSGVKPEEDEYLEIGTEIGFDPKRIAKLWQALANLALHVRLPVHKADQIPAYGDKVQIRAKIDEIVAELKRLSKGTMTFSGLGNEVSFVCSCGEKNRRRAGLLRHGQSISCINPKCMASWTAMAQGDGFVFESEAVEVDCSECECTNLIHRRHILSIKLGETGSFSCHSCEHKNHMQWKLMQARKSSAPERSEQPQ